MPPKPPSHPIAHPNLITACPCGSGLPLDACCLQYIQGLKHAPTAESLMRSRYTAHTLLAIDYLWETWDKTQRKRSTPEDIRAWASSCDWLGLDIIATDKGTPEDATGIVSFIARFRQNNQVHEHREISLFHKIAGQWIYVDHA